MRITILTTKNHPVVEYLKLWRTKNQQWDIEIKYEAKDLAGGDFLFLISCSQLISQIDRNKFLHSLVVHASDLPQGRGWSPHVWEILNGKNQITVTLLEAEDKVDSGKIWAKKQFMLEGHELYDEINAQLFEVTLQLMDLAAKGIALPEVQKGQSSYWPKRSPLDSEISVYTTLHDAFNMLRVCDPFRFPAYFKHLGHTYKITIEKMADNEQL